MKTIVLFALLCFFTSSAYGQIQCVKGEYCYIELFGSSLNITVDVDATVSLSLYTQLSATANLPAGFTSLAFTASVGFTLDVQPPSATILSARFVTPSLSLASQAALVTGASVGCLQYDSNLNWYNEFSVSSIDTGNKKLVVNFPSSGTYIFAIVSASATLPALYNKQRDIPSNKTQEIKFPYGLLVTLKSQYENKLNVSYSQQNPKGKEPQGKVAFGKFWNFVATTENNLNATLRVTYNKSEVIAKGIKEESLRLAFYNEISGEWEFMSTGGSIDIQSSTVIQVTPHFSTWAVYGDSTSDDSFASTVVINFMMIATLIVALTL